MEHWYTLYTKPNREQQVQDLLHKQGIETYLPTVRRRVRRRDRPDRIVYFPCYLFARLDFDTTPRSSIDWMPGVRRVISSGNEPTMVADEVVAVIRRRLEGIEQVGYGELQQGVLVRIVSGPLRELEAVFDRPLPAANRVRILLQVLGHSTPVEIYASHIKKV
jgi:transcription elongation factor/antiterminator RfaH